MDTSAAFFLGQLAEEKSLGEELAGVRASHDRRGRRLEAAEAAADADRLAVSEETADCAIPKDSLYALSNKRSWACSAPATTRRRQRDLAARVDAGRREMTELRTRAAEQGGHIEEIAAR